MHSIRTPIGIFFIIAILILMDTYIFQAIKTVNQTASPKFKMVIYSVYWIISAAAVTSFLLFLFTEQNFMGKKFRTYLFTTFIGLFLAKLIAIIFFFVDDLRRVAQWITGKVFSNNLKFNNLTNEGISRSAFLSWLGLAAGGSLFGSLLYGFGNKYNYHIKRMKMSFANLPAAFKGLKIIHISDIHSGSLADKRAVLNGVQKIINAHADIIFFTGDLVNDRATEMEDYIEIFKQLKAPMGVFSIFGNHDYGDYVSWPYKGITKDQNLENLKKVHTNLGWRLLMNEHVVLEKGGAEIALLGIENWSNKIRFPKHGRMDLAHTGTEKYPFKILLSHDPSHWDAQVKTKYADVDLMLSGHTHGMQFGIEIPGFKWSPIQYIYKQWSGLYEDGKQKLYVNPGFGFLGYPGRVGILPEITLIELI